MNQSSGTQMVTHNMKQRSSDALNPKGLSPENLARLLTASGPMPVTTEKVQADIDAGAPTNPNGTVNLVHYAAWLVKEMAHGN